MNARANKAKASDPIEEFISMKEWLSADIIR